MISVSVLGPVELHRDGVAVPVRPGKTTELLIRLALEAGVMVRTERLIEDLWADEAVGIARNPLQTEGVAAATLARRRLARSPGREPGTC